MLTESPAIVLKAVDFKESSKIVTFFSREHGKMAILMRGIKRRKNKYTGLVAYGSVLNMSYYYKTSRAVQTFKDAEPRFSTYRIQDDFSRLAVTMAFLELVSQLIQEGEPNEELFTFSENLLRWMNDSDASVRSLFPYLQFRIADIMGVGLQPLTSMATTELHNTPEVYINIAEGTLSNRSGEERAIRLSPPQILYLALASSGKSSRLPALDMETQELKQLINHLDTYLKFHIDGLRDRKSDAVFEQIL